MIANVKMSPAFWYGRLQGAIEVALDRFKQGDIDGAISYLQRELEISKKRDEVVERKISCYTGGVGR